MTKEETRELIDIMQAYADGKEIQVSYKEQNNNWSDIYSDPLWNFEKFKYRIKPDSKYRPYANAQEFLQAMKEHGPLIKNFCKYMSVLNVYCDRISLYGTSVFNISFKSLCTDCYTWQDKSPCGILEK